jgi:4-amino-4-deoxy-L-arabinose transferase-like glycosyltransferase
MIIMAIDIAFLQSEQTLIPFLFVLAIVFGVLELTKIFRNRGVNFLIALAIAFFTITNTAFVTMLWSYFGSITTLFIIMFFIAFVFEVFGLRGGGQRESNSSLFINGAILFILLSIGFLNASLIPDLPFIGGGKNLVFLFAIVFVLAIFWAAFKIGGPKEKVLVPVKGG